ncbi:MAG: hypothetical protein ACK5MV_03885 [Aminipila sp.]
MSGTIAGSLIFDTKTDLSGFNKGVKDIDTNFKKVTKEVANTGEKVEKKLREPINKVTKEVSELDGAFQKLGTIIVSAFSVHKIMQFGQEVLSIASDLNEVQNVVDTTFQNSTGEINKFAETALEKFGLSELSAKQISSTIGAMFKSMGLGKKDILEMSQGITGLAGDMASFYNLEPEVAFEKLRAGISGETEPLKQLGINMSVVNLEAFAMSEGINKMLDFAEGLANGFINAANLVIKALDKISFTIPDWVPNIGGETFGININELSKVSIPRLATGAVIPPNSEFLAILGDQKNGTNIGAPLSTIEQAVDNVLSRRGYSGGGNATVILQIDGREFARVIDPYNTGETSRQGVRLIDGII